MADFSFVKVFHVIQTLCEIIPVSPFCRKTWVNHSKVKILQIFVYLSLYVALSVIYYDEYTSQLPTEFLKIKTISFVVIFRTFANVAVMMIIYLTSFLGFRQFAIEMKKLQSVDQQLNKLDFLGFLPKSNREVRNKSLVLIVIVHVVFNIFGCVLTVVLRDFNSVATFLGVYVVSLFPRVVIGNSNLIFYVTLMLLTNRFRVINNDIAKRIDDSKIARKYPSKVGFCEDMRYLVDLHKTLVKIAKDINSIYAVHLLVWIAVTFVLLVGDLYVTMYIFFFHLSGTPILSILVLFKNVLMYAFDLFILAKFTTDLCDEANSTKRLIVRMKIDIDKEDERNSVIVGALKLGQNNLDITACRFFNIDNALLFSICGAASSYLFIMIQLDMGNMNDTETNASVTEPPEYFNASTIYN